MEESDSFSETLHKSIGTIMYFSIHGILQSSRQSGFSMSQIGALFYLDRHSSGVSHLGDMLGVSNAAASQMLDRLAGQGLIRRSESPDDRRMKRIVLTEKGREVLQESIRFRQDWLNRLAASLSAEEKDRIEEALKILLDKAGRLA